MKRILSLAALLGAVAAGPAQGSVLPDRIVEFFDSGAGPIAGPYGGDDSNSPVPISPAFLLSSAPNNGSFLSLPTGSYITLGFSRFHVVDGLGADFEIEETGNTGDIADVFVSSNDTDFTRIGQAFSGITTRFDLALSGFAAPVTSIRIQGLDNNGSSPGFDLVALRALSVAPAAVPEPATWATMIVGLAGVGGVLRRRGARGSEGAPVTA